MDVRDYLRVLRKRWWMLLAGIGVACGLAGILTSQMTPQYATSVTFFVTTPNNGVTDAYQGGLFSQQRVKSYATLLTGDRLAKVVAAKTPGLELTPAEVRERITAEALPETVLLQATVTDGSAERSRLIAGVLAREFTTMVEALETPRDRTASPIKVEVVAGPTGGDTPVSPKPLRNLALAALLGLLAGGVAAVLRETLDTTVKTADALHELAGAPVLAGVPFDADARSGPLRLTGSGHSPRSEALRQLRTNLQFVDVDRPVKTLVITSAMPGEGKSSTACTLAGLFAEAGQRVLLIDADLRRPRIADYLGLEGAVGLTTVLAGRASIADVVQPWSEGMWALPSGSLPPNPSELLGSQHMADLLEQFREQYDMVIVDCPPLLPVTDGAVVAARADGALLLARSHKTTSSQIQTAARALQSVDARLLGCVFNMVSAKGPEGYYYEQYGMTSQHRRGAWRDRMRAPATTELRDLMACGEPESAPERRLDEPIGSGR
ncbi:polysaccharide biosynthesis tyrosine autokinase [Pseudosporangium ferrugineum]|uniref:non-specific protein-tyrosine kinase n=1 Tax=Pseudosporangium ferrugineum TaxID=439699 RepID=A0A2T0S3C8_9ACTN|nr:polysaccharide biosynthesis tyrosine autokinase [Pseudosporangium ferrugineum]PRY27925.1 capsular exopolysaccharide synthesis family protein [Pseudosporangium ferrugineum]